MQLEFKVSDLIKADKFLTNHGDIGVIIGKDYDKEYPGDCYYVMRSYNFYHSIRVYPNCENFILIA